MECVGKQIGTIPLTIITPPAITPIEMTVGYMITNAAKRDAAKPNLKGVRDFRRDESQPPPILGIS